VKKGEGAGGSICVEPSENGLRIDSCMSYSTTCMSLKYLRCSTRLAIVGRSTNPETYMLVWYLYLYLYGICTLNQQIPTVTYQPLASSISLAIARALNCLTGIPYAVIFAFPRRCCSSWVPVSHSGGLLYVTLQIQSVITFRLDTRALSHHVW